MWQTYIDFMLNFHIPKAKKMGQKWNPLTGSQKSSPKSGTCATTNVGLQMATCDCHCARIALLKDQD